jgi:16S rRNA (adenine1518-N6/adenine1519-N6)-dimethyltransferase
VINLLGAAEIRALAKQLNLKPKKKLGQNFVIDGNTCRKIVKLTLALLDQAKQVMAIEIDKRLADQLPITIARHGVDQDKLVVINEDALVVRDLPIKPSVLVANLPYNVSVPVLLNILDHFPTITRGVVMVQSEVADRLVAKVNSKAYGSPTVKANWWARLKIAGMVSRSVFWPIPNVDSCLVRFDRHLPPGSEAERVATFSVVDQAFAKRRKMLRSSLSQLFKSDSRLALNRAGIDPTSRGEVLSVVQFLAIGQQLLNDNSTK